jgi:uncharacterized integral membrane protein
MPWKLLFFIVVLALVVTFVGLNVGNTSDISFGFHSFSEVPIFISLFAAFLLGVLVTLPATLWSSKRGRKTPKVKEKKGKGRKKPRAELPADTEAGTDESKAAKTEPTSDTT